MRAVSRVTTVLLTTAAAALAPVGVDAQQTAPTNNQSTQDAVGPRELQNFKLPGTVTRPADQPPAASQSTPPAATQTAPAAQAPAPRSVERTPNAANPTRRSPAPTERTERPQATTSAPTQAPIAAPPAPLSSSTTAPAPVPNSFQSAPPVAAPPSGPAIPTFAWLLAALLLGAGGAFLFMRLRARHAFAGADDQSFEPAAFERSPASTAPAPSPPAALPPAPAEPAAPPPAAPTPPPSPSRDEPAKPVGIVSTRLRPWIEIGFAPVRCVLDQERATIDFELELLNSGSGPARNVAIAATAFNAGPTQDAMIDNYFAQPAEPAHGVDFIPPLDRAAVALSIAIPREQLQPYDVGGQQVFVPLLAVTVTYAWGGSEGQTSASYLIGRDTGGEKLAPLRIEAAGAAFNRLGAKVLSQAVRR